MLKRITARIRKVLATTEPPSSAPPRPASGRFNPRAKVSGRLCLRGASRLRERLHALLGRRDRSITLDLSRVRFLDGGALAVLCEFARACRNRGVSLNLVSPSPQVWNTFSLYGLRDALIELADFDEVELDGVLIIVDEDFADSIRLPAAA